MNLIRRHPVVPTIVLGVASAAVLSIIFATAVSAENPGHALAHVAQASFFAIVGGAAVWLWPPADGSRKWSRRLVVGGCALVVVSLLLEAIGAFGYDGNASRVPLLTATHNSAFLLAAPGLLALLLGSLLALGPRAAPVTET